MSLQNVIEEMVIKSLEDGQYYREITFGLSDLTVKRLKKDTSLNFSGYIGVIDSDHVRHINRRHPKHVILIKYAPKILDQYDSAEKSLTRNQQTGQTEVSLVIKKRFGEYLIQMVKLRIMKKKRLLLKTMFVRD